jgi:hypothetical protein
MRCAASLWPAAAIAAVGLGLIVDPPASACDAGCGSRYAPSLYGPPAYAGSAVVYMGPPVYVYSYFSPAYGAAAAAYAYGPTYYESYYTTRIGILRGPRWDHSAAYYTSPPVYGAYYGRGLRRGGAHRFYRPHYGYIRGPVIRSSRPW